VPVVWACERSATRREPLVKRVRAGSDLPVQSGWDFNAEPNRSVGLGFRRSRCQSGSAIVSEIEKAGGGVAGIWLVTLRRLRTIVVTFSTAERIVAVFARKNIARRSPGTFTFSGACLRTGSRRASFDQGAWPLQASRGETMVMGGGKRKLWLPARIFATRR